MSLSQETFSDALYLHLVTDIHFGVYYLAGPVL